MQEPTRKQQTELWTVEAGEYEDHHILGTFTERSDAIEYRDRYNARPGLSRFDRAHIGTIAHNPTI